ncbi:hypothetical protein NLG97_g297 [Lecanicillium saksenae]|uniref:Uncharacterized protein n=1 Tax=Lecanicillium saksenae TaxID=468837 RepID=A0ACC1R8N8_9HYPO|nr:hypothetical protein NLG97_g297 [Lecanicillium saksenae]
MSVTGTSPFYVDYFDFFPNSSNILAVPYGDVSKSFATPVSSKSAKIAGYDWTQPFPGSKKDGHGVYLSVGKEMPLSEQIVEDATTVLSSLTFSAPDGLMSGGHPKAMDPSWYICRHIFISTNAAAKKAVDGGDNTCSFLSKDCAKDLTTSLTKDWGTADQDSMCSAFIFDMIPQSCFDSFGSSRQDVMAFDSKMLADPDLGLLQTSKDQERYSWRMGTGYHDPGSALPYQMAANRTYLVATVWGYSRDAKTKKTPDVSFGCVSPGEAYVPPPATTSTSTTSTSTQTSTSTSSQLPTSTPIPTDSAFSDDFSSGKMDRWSIYSGNFVADSKAMVGLPADGGRALIQSNYADFLFDADVTPTLNGTTHDAGLLFRVNNIQDEGSYEGYYAGISASGYVVLGRTGDGQGGRDYKELANVKATISPDTAHRVRVQAIGSDLGVYVDDMAKPKITAKDSAYYVGMDGVQVNLAATAFDNVRITPLLFHDEFDGDNMDSWTGVDGKVSTGSGQLVAFSPGAKALINKREFSDLAYEADVSFAVPTGNGGLIFRVGSAGAGDDTYQGYYAGIGNGFVVLGVANNNWKELSRVNTTDVQARQAYRMRVEAKGDTISVFVGDMSKARLTVKDSTYKSGKSGVRTFKTPLFTDNVRIYAL